MQQFGMFKLLNHVVFVVQCDLDRNSTHPTWKFDQNLEIHDLKIMYGTFHVPETLALMTEPQPSLQLIIGMFYVSFEVNVI